jgi:hypothetical protein
MEKRILPISNNEGDEGTTSRQRLEGQTFRVDGRVMPDQAGKHGQITSVDGGFAISTRFFIGSLLRVDKAQGHPNGKSP